MKAYIFFIMALLILPLIAKAEEPIESYKKAMPVFEALGEQKLNELTDWYEEVPYGKQALAYKVRIPKGWKNVNAGGSQEGDVKKNVLDEVAKFFSPARLEGRSSIRIQALKLEHKFTAEQWLIQYLLAQGYAIEAFESKGEKRAEAIVVHAENDVQYAIRVATVINGSEVLLIQYLLPIQFWADERQLQMEVIASFQPVNILEDVVEEMVQFQFLDIAEVSYPKSWELRSNPVRSIDRMGIELINVASKEVGKRKTVINVGGRMEVKLVSLFAAQSLPEEIERQKAEFEESGLRINEKIEMYDDLKTRPGYDFAGVDVFKAVDRNDKLIDYEFWFGMFVHGDYLYFVTLLTPSRTEDYFSWARNTQTYRTVVELLEPKKPVKRN